MSGSIIDTTGYAYPLAISSSSDKIVALAWKDWTKKVVDNYQKVVNAISAANVAIADTVTTGLESDADALSAATEAFTASMLDQGASLEYTFSTNAGNIKVRDLIKAMVTAGVPYYASIMRDNIVKDFDIKFTTTDGVEVSYPNFSLFDELNATMHSTVVEYAVASAYDYADNVSDRINVFRDVVGQYFNSAYTDVSNMLHSAAEKLKTVQSVAGYIKQEIKESGIIKASETGDPYSVSDLYQYSGATPASAFTWNTAREVVSSTVKVAATVVKNTVKSLWNKVTGLFSKAVNKVKEVVVDPYDLAAINGSLGNHTINGFFKVDYCSPSFLTSTKIVSGALQYELRSGAVELMKGPLHLDMITGEVMIAPNDQLNDMRIDNDTVFGNASLLYRMKFGVEPDQNMSIIEILNLCSASQTTPDFTTIDSAIKALNSEYLGSLPDTTLFVDMIQPDLKQLSLCMLSNAYQTKFLDYGFKILTKPKPLTSYVSQYAMLGNMQWEDRSSTPELKPPRIVINQGKASQFVDRLRMLYESDTLYADTADTGETEMYNAFILGGLCHRILMAILNTEANGSDVDSVVIEIPYEFNPFDTHTTHASGINQPWLYASSVKVNNGDFIAAAVMHSMDPQTGIYYAGPGDTNEAYDLAYQASVMNCISNVFDYQAQNVDNYAFWPYSHTNIEWFPPSFQVKTDADNAKAFETFVTAAIIVAAVAVVAITSIVVAKKIARTVALKEEGARYAYENKLIAGTATKEDKKMYSKYRSLNKVTSKLTGNMTTSANSLDLASMAGDVSGLTAAQTEYQTENLSTAVELVKSNTDQSVNDASSGVISSSDEGFATIVKLIKG